MSHSDPARPNTLVMVISAMMTSLVAIVFARMAYGLILPTMRADLGLSYAQAGNLGTVTALGYLLFVLPGGVAAARWGASRAVILGMGMIAAGFLGLVVAQAYAVIVGLMLLLGLGTAFCFAPMLALLATWYPECRGLMIGWMTTGIGVGIFLSGVLVPPIIEWTGPQGWRVVWGLFACFAVVAAVLVLLWVRDPPTAAQARNDGTVPAPLDKWAVYRNWGVIRVGLVYAVLGGVYIVQGLFMVSFVEASGYASTTAGGLFAMSGLLSVIFGPPWGWLSDRWGRGNALMLSMSLVAVGMVLPALSQSLPVFFLHFLITGCSVSGAFTMTQAASTDQVDTPYIPIAVSFVTLFFAAGQFLGPAVGGWLIQHAGFRTAWLFCGAMMLLAIYLSHRVRVAPPARPVD